jgi:threonine synthase
VIYEHAEGTKPEDLFPVSRESIPQLPVGNTPLWRAEKLDSKSALYLKDDTGNLTGSFKDRASLLVAAFALEHGIDEIVLASTGNAASSMAGIAAACGLRSTVFMPATAPQAKMVQVLQYGAKLITVDGNYDKAFELSLEYAREHGLLSRNTAYNPLTIEGKKSVSTELFRQLGHVPDYVFVPVGDGVILSGVYKGFRDLMKLGLAQKMPQVVAVQAAGSAAVHDALKEGTYRMHSARTLADSIAVDVPRCGYYALKQLQRYGGRAVTVSDDEILRAQKTLSECAGLFAEPAAAASYAGYRKIKKEIPETAETVLLITGNGLKDVPAASKMLTFPARAIRELEEIE